MNFIVKSLRKFSVDGKVDGKYDRLDLAHEAPVVRPFVPNEACRQAWGMATHLQKIVTAEK